MPLDEDVDDQGVDKLNKNIKELVGEGEALDSLSARTVFELLIYSLLFVNDRLLEPLLNVLLSVLCGYSN